MSLTYGQNALPRSDENLLLTVISLWLRLRNTSCCTEWIYCSTCFLLLKRVIFSHFRWRRNLDELSILINCRILTCSSAQWADFTLQTLKFKNHCIQWPGSEIQQSIIFSPHLLFYSFYHSMTAGVRFNPNDCTTPSTHTLWVTANARKQRQKGQCDSTQHATRVVEMER